jgi:tetratricopeptide (TPR) repeat protein
VLYGNTLNHDYTQDDAIVIYDNMYTKQGIKGIPGLLTKDTFFGFFKKEGKAKLVSGGRYRPLTPIMFAIEYEVFGDNPKGGHLLNILWYSLLCILVFQVISLLLTDYTENSIKVVLSLFITLLFAAHPVHTEVVANIKGRDEIIALLGSLYALKLTIFNAEKFETKRAITIAIVFFLACMAKENAITFIAIIPLTLWLILNKTIGNAFKLVIPALIGASCFLIIRTLVLGLDFGGTKMELMNNPFLKFENGTYILFTFAEKFATISVILLKYLQLLIAPITLSHDYYPRYFEIYNFSDLKPLVGIIVNGGLLLLSLIWLKKDKIFSFSILFYFITGSIVSNIFFPVGTNMSERFLFMPSFGYALLLGYILFKITKGNKVILSSLSIMILALYSFKTIDRNPTWKNDYTLFTTDVHHSPNSAKINNAAGGASVTEAFKLPDGPQKTELLQNAIGYLNQAVKIHPTYKNAYLLLGNAYYYLNNYTGAIPAYEKALQVDSNYEEASKNLGVTLRDAGRKAGEIERDLNKSIALLKKSAQVNPTDSETYRLLGVSHGIAKKHEDAIKYFTKVVELNPDNAAAYMNLSNAYTHIGDEENTRLYRSKALSLDPSVYKNN